MAELPEKIGPYRVVRKIGEGGMGAVYEGIHELIERRVAIKVLHPAYAVQREFTNRFFNEARAVNRVDHAGIVAISDYGQLPDSTAYIVMEYLSGETLSARIKKYAGPLPIEQALNLGSQLADALAAAHEKNVIHRDLKPDNVIIVADSKAPGGERTKLLDFGIAKMPDEGGSSQDPGFVKTSTSSLMGTPYYMSPEQCRGAGHVDGRSDVYALGVMLYEMLSGVRPITGEGQGDILIKHVTEDPMPLNERMPGLPAVVVDLVHRMMVKDRDKRLVMADASNELEALSAQYPPAVTRRFTASMAIIAGPPPEPSPSVIRTGTGTAAGQTTSTQSTRSRGLGIGLALSVVAALTVGFLGWRTLSKKPVAVVAPVVAPQEVRWRIDTTPPGAEVLEASDGRSLGLTPFTTQHPMAQGTRRVKLRLRGYDEQELELRQSSDETRNVILVEVKPPPTETPPVPEVTASVTKPPETGKPGKPGKALLTGKPKKSKHRKSVVSKGGGHIED